MNCVLGIDPGLASTGYAVVEGGPSRLRVRTAGTLRTGPRTPHPARLRSIHDAVLALIGEHPIDSAAIEAWFVHPVSRSAMAMAEARGAIMVAIAGAEIEIAEYTPNTIKQAVTGQGAADKAQVRAMVTRLTGTDGDSDHAADAIAAAICHLSSAGMRRALRGAR
ncbi:MAG TPA: crossover junction endodeoxyribonuclease RuvC [Miltoncostaeaceae bacterium]|nr:crossover junction endodeoxyribonuclease RuvC [Miltoncostaeaceae bacterium]